MISAGLDRCECAIALVAEGDDEKWERSWREEKNARGEALVLLTGGHLLVVKLADRRASSGLGPQVGRLRGARRR